MDCRLCGRGAGRAGQGASRPPLFYGHRGGIPALRRDWPVLFSPWHLAGLALFAAIIGAWQLPFYWELDATSAHSLE